MKNKLKNMMEQLIRGEYGCNEFSYDFPEELLQVDDDDLLAALDDMPELCAAYDPYKDDEPELLNDEEFILKVKEVYENAFN